METLFASNHELCDDIKKSSSEANFKNLIFGNFINDEKRLDKNIDKTPYELLKEAGYTLYKCNTQEEILEFKKYYKPNEELCTFRDQRLLSNFVYFAVKDNVKKINRDDFVSPEREDLYGTSVISIQFLKNESRRLSIKNRYNHSVKFPDVTFNNNLDNIISGLTASFAKYEGMKQKDINVYFSMRNYVTDENGKYYKYNYELNNIYFCKDNYYITDCLHKEYRDRARYIFIENYIIDLKEKSIKLLNEQGEDAFIKSIGKIKK